MTLPFTKMHGAGNDFVVVDDRHGTVPWQDVERMKAIGDRRLGVGCEGIILIQNAQKSVTRNQYPVIGKTSSVADCCSPNTDYRLPITDYRMTFLNPDGRPAAMCGNGARCAAFFAYHNGIAGKRQRIQTMAGSVEAEIVEVTGNTAHVCITVPEPKPPVEKRIMVDGREWVCQCLDTGVPHAVIFVDDVDAIDVKRIGRAIRNHDAFAPEGTNVNFVQSSVGVPAADGGTEASATLLRIRTYERGVEDESGACGTGAIAAAVASWNAPCTMHNAQCRFEVSSGDILSVKKTNEGLTLTGPAVIVFHGEISL